MLCILYRIGQTKPVRVYQLIAENTVESKVGAFELVAVCFFKTGTWLQVIDIQEKKKQLIKHVRRISRRFTMLRLTCHYRLSLASKVERPNVRRRRPDSKVSHICFDGIFCLY